jgi:hypothetical protein
MTPTWFDEVTARRGSEHQGQRGRAVIKVVDGNGNKVVQLTADSQGAFIRVKDANGNDVVNMKATRPARSQGQEGQAVTAI